jgi:hypothetical protein
MRLVGVGFDVVRCRYGGCRSSREFDIGVPGRKREEGERLGSGSWYEGELSRRVSGLIGGKVNDSRPALAKDAELHGERAVMVVVVELELDLEVEFA